LRLQLTVPAVFCGLTASVRPVVAQTAVPEHEYSAIVGVAVDSIRGGYLRNATVIVDGTTRSAITDSLGRFSIDSIEPGEHRLRVRHPLLDTLGMVVVTAPKKIDARERLAMVISTPSAKTIIAAKCPATEIARGPAAVFGVVFDAENEDPSTDATVATQWSGLQVARKGISVVPQKRSTRVNADGRFQLCGLPNDLTAGIVAARGTDSTASVQVDLSTGIAILSLHLPHLSGPVTATAPSRAPAAAPSTPITSRDDATVTGRVIDADNRPVEGARVQIEQDALTATTAKDGTFRISGARAGTRTITARKLGFAPVQKTVDLRNTEARNVNFKLDKFVPVLETIEITARQNQGLESNGFNARRRRGEGDYITPEEIARRSSPRVNDLLPGVSFLRFKRLPNGKDSVIGRPSAVGGTSGCVRYYVDNVPWVSTEDTPDEFYHPSEIGAIEVYRPQLVPPQFMAFSRTGELCYVVVLWTKSGLLLK
jgi:hypothetical protein